MPARKPPAWTPQEIAILSDIYPREGLNGATNALPERSWQAIYQMAHNLRLKAPILADAPKPRLAGDRLEEAIRLREVEKWSFARIGALFGVSECGTCNAVLIALCPRKGFTPAPRDATGRLLPEGFERLRLMLRIGMKGVDIQLRLGVSAGRVAEERRRYRRDLKERGKATLPPPGTGQAYSGVKLTKARKAEVEGLLLQGWGTLKVSQKTGASKTSITRIRNRLIKRLARKGDALPGCDITGRRHEQKESSRFIRPEQVAELRRRILAREPVSRAAREIGIGGSSAYRIRDTLAAELAALGEALPIPRLPGSGPEARQASLVASWLPIGTKNIYRYRELLRDHPPAQAKAMFLAELADRQRAMVERQRAEAGRRRAETARPKTFEEKLAAVRAGATISSRIDIRKADPAMTLGGIGTAAL